MAESQAITAASSPKEVAEQVETVILMLPDSPDVTAVHVSVDPAESDKVREKWTLYGEGTRLVILDSPYRLMIEPVMEYIKSVLAVRQPHEFMTVVVPQFVPGHWWENLLHSQTALLLRFALLFNPGLVIVEVPYQV